MLGCCTGPDTTYRSPRLRFRGLVGVLPYFVFCTAIAVAAAPAEEGASDAPSSWTQVLWNLPVVGRFLIPSPTLPPIAAANGCAVTPLTELTDSDALAFESQDGPDVSGLLPAMSQAMEKFRRLVMSAGGTFDLKSAYRPAAYQEHLQDVWFKWMRDLRRNRTAACEGLRAAVHEEFLKHHLLETQMPVTASDHTRGMAFDADIKLPRVAAAKKKRRRISIDRLALIAGLQRPDVRHDPVHFKLVGKLRPPA